MVRFGLLGLVGGFMVVVSAAPLPKQVIQSPIPCFGGSLGRNMANRSATNLPDNFSEEKKRGILWEAPLGTRSYSQPVVSQGVVLVGTNNERPRNSRDTKLNPDGEIEPIDKDILMCFDAKTGEFRWQAVHDKNPNGPVNLWPKQGNVSTPCVDEERVYYVSANGRVVCLDINGFANGNQGYDQEKYQSKTDADILWEISLEKEHGVFVHDIAACSPLVVGNIVFVVTGNGVDATHQKVPAPQAPSFLALDKFTGKLIWKDSSPGKNIMHGQWSSPTYTDEPVPQIIYGAGDGYLRSFEPQTGKLLWQFNGNSPTALHKFGGDGEKNDFIATPVAHQGKLIIGLGQDPEHFTGIGCLWCLDLKRAVELGRKNKDRDVSITDFDDAMNPKLTQDSVALWHFGGRDSRPFSHRKFHFGRTISTVCIVDDLVYAAELQGFLHCFDLQTGKHYWQYDVKSSIWASPYYADGKVYLCTEQSDLFIFRHNANPVRIDPIHEMNLQSNARDANKRYKAVQKELEDKILIRKIELDVPMYSTPFAMGSVLYLNTEKSLFAIGEKK